MVGTAVLRMVVSSDSMKNATAMSHGRRPRLDSDMSAGAGADRGASMGLAVPTLVAVVLVGTVSEVTSVNQFISITGTTGPLTHTASLPLTVQ